MLPSGCQRFWYRRPSRTTEGLPPEGLPVLDSNGYLAQPSSNPLVAAALVPFSMISARPCLVLLGDPGMGKTVCLQAECKRVEALDDDNRSYWFDLADYTDEALLHHHLFSSESIAQWKQSASTLHLFLDSLDECQLRIETVAKSLIKGLQESDYPLDRLYLRIICRTNSWDTALEERLERLFDTVGVYQLAPLRKIDISAAALERGLDQDSFIHAIEEKGVVSLAVRPITLDFLLRTYKSYRGLPSTQDELYFSGCKELCEEFVRSHELHRVRNAQSLLKVASRIAALSVFSNRAHVITNPRLNAGVGQYLSISDLTDDEEYVDQEGYLGFIVDKKAVEEAMQTALFSSSRTGFRSWSHHSYAEFLAAWYVHHSMSFEQLLSLISVPDGARRTIVPQLQETASWLASMDEEVFDAVISIDPEILLGSSVILNEANQRKILTDKLLWRYEQKDVSRFNPELYGKYSKLNHPQIAQQLTSYFVDKDKREFVRESAIDIASMCGLQSLADSLVKMALDQSEPHRVRVHASYALINIGVEEAKAKLRPLAFGTAGEDPDDELKGCGLKALWPNHLTVEELFTLVTPPKNKSLLGAYYSFLFGDMIRNLNPIDLPVALAHVRKVRENYSWGFELSRLGDQIILKALEHLETPGVLSSLASAVLRRLDLSDTIVGITSRETFRRLIENDVKRRKLLCALLGTINSDQKLWMIANAEQRLVLSRDVGWILDSLKKTKSQRLKRMLSDLVILTYDRGDLQQINLIFRAQEAGELCGDLFEQFFGYIELDSPYAERLKRQYHPRGHEEKHSGASELSSTLQDLVAKQLDKCDSGDHAAWISLTKILTGEYPGPHLGHAWFDELDLTKQLGWVTASEQTQSRLVEAAYDYLLQHNLAQKTWLSRDLYDEVLAGCKAIALLLDQARIKLEDSSAQKIWEKWAPAIISYAPFFSEDKEVQQRMVTLAYYYAPDIVLNALDKLIDRAATPRIRTILDKFKGFWDERISALILRKVRDRKTSADGLRYLIDPLLTQDPENACKFVASLFFGGFPDTMSLGVRWAKAVEVASVCFAQTNNQCWDLVWSAMASFPSFGRQALSKSIESGQIENMNLSALDEKTQAGLYVWLENEYPAEEMDQGGAAWAATPSGMNIRVLMIKNTILIHLVSLGSRAAVNSIEEVVLQLPSCIAPKLALEDARKAMRTNEWIPLEPQAIQLLARDRAKRLVRNEAELVDLVVAQLRHMEKQLHDESLSVEFLWDERGKQRFVPKLEQKLSDWIRLYLDQNVRERGIIALREVEIRRKRADIFVAAVKKGAFSGRYDRLTVVIEAKGCWHSELKEAMEKQLFDRYLKNNEYAGGIYVVGWYYCEKWDKTDSKFKKAQRNSVQNPQQYFDDQAKFLSKKGPYIKALVINTALD
jgi:hypothetical protein